jgi:hypothetical protein
MRARTGIAIAALTMLAVSAGSTLVACFDLLHSTADVLTACELDAGHPGCLTTTVETNFCAWNPVEAKTHARDACLWLGACEGPLGNNAFGPCYFRALMAYDCVANPDHRPQGKARELWDCLQKAKSCGQVDACMFQGASSRTECSAGVDTACSESVPGVRLLCADGGKPAEGRENCALWGQTCAPGAGGATCAGESTGLACKLRCDDDGTTLHWCVPGEDGGPGVDRGIQCASNGGGACGGFPSVPAQWVACLPGGDAAACTPDASATCEDGRATMCPSGVLETLDCKALLGTGSACTAGGLSPPFDWTSPCSSASACADDSCAGGQLTSCERGTSFTIDCKGQGFAGCRLLAADPGAPARAACTPPP